MTSNERKILRCLWDTKGEATIRVVAQQIGFSHDYTRLISNSLARAGYIKFADAHTCCLLKKGWRRFESRFPEKIQSRTASAGQAPILTQELDVLFTPEKEETEESMPMFEGELKGASKKEKAKLANAGYKTIKDLADVSVVTLIQNLGVSLRKAATWINQAKREKGLL